MGMISDPIAAVSAIADPEMPPKSRQETTQTTPSPPGMKPKRVAAKATMRLPTPPLESSSPPKMNNGTAIRMKGSTPEMKLRKIVSRGWERSNAQIMPTVVASSAYMSGTPAHAITKNTAKIITANIAQSPYRSSRGVPRRIWTRS